LLTHFLLPLLAPAPMNKNPAPVGTYIEGHITFPYLSSRNSMPPDSPVLFYLPCSFLIVAPLPSSQDRTSLVRNLLISPVTGWASVGVI